MQEVLELRKEHGNVFVTTLPEGDSIPWRPLTVGEYIEYDKLFKMKTYPPAYLENEIFRKCVLDNVLVQNIDQLKAGIVQAVTVTILSYSGPQSVSELNQFINVNRHEAAQALHQLATTIVQAFPAYKLEDVYAMDYATFTLRVAQAEEKLLRTGLITEPLSILSKDAEGNIQVEETPKPSPVDLKARHDKQQQKRVEHPKPPPVPTSTDTTVITKADIMEHQQVMTAHEKDLVHQKKSADETAEVYSEYVEQMNRGEAPTILTPEERVEAAAKRSAEHKKNLLEKQKELLKDAAAERKELLKVREKERARRKRLANRKK